jgi:EpsI family protein
MDRAWPPAIVLAVGALLATAGVRSQRTLPLRAPLAATIPSTIEGHEGRDIALSPEEVEAAGVTTYLARVYESADTTGLPGASGFATLYIGYYDRQTQGRTIHSPKNCLPGSGWEPLVSRTAAIPTAGDSITVNRYLIQKGSAQALVLYWYQGRGRVAANEYLVKWDLVRDAALRRRSDEALVRVVVPVTSSEETAFRDAARVASAVSTALDAALPS